MLSLEHSTISMTDVDHSNEEMAVRQRLKAFKLGSALPSLPLSAEVPSGPMRGHRHQRSHSRNTSISSGSSMSLSSLSSFRSSGLHDLSNFSSFLKSNSPLAQEATSTTPANSVPSLGPPSKRNSHHRRRSSVSTRRESAELMGVSVPDLPASSSENNINLGEKDSIRRRALWALEGKPDLAFNKVEIPELSTPVIEKIMFDFSTKPSFSGVSSAGFSNSGMGSKRDSFKLLPPSGSNKDQLGTLVEEEEEEEEVQEDSFDNRDAVPTSLMTSQDVVTIPVTPVSTGAVKPASSKPRPATLNLRPLSLTPESVGAVTNQGLPTPSLTPSPSPRPGLRSLSLKGEDSASIPPAETAFGSHRPALNVKTDSSFSKRYSDDIKPARRSGISYRSSVIINSAGLPTPEMTPTFSRRSSVTESIRSSQSDDEFFPSHPRRGSTSAGHRSLSASEQLFLYKSHNALLQRITDLEMALSTKRVSLGYSSSGGGYSRPSSVMSDASLVSETGSGTIPGEPNDEMLTFIRDLKAERDELKKDVDGWRKRVNDLEKQLGVVAKRVETERREAWVARSRVGLLEAEKAVLEKRIEGIDQMLMTLNDEKRVLENQNKELKTVVEQKAKRVEELEKALEVAKMELEEALQREEESRIRQEQYGDLLATPTPNTFGSENMRGFTFPRRMDLGFGPESHGFSIEDDSDAPTFNFGLPRETIRDQDDEETVFSDEDNGLGGYEDEDELDAGFHASSSVESMDYHGFDVPVSPITPSTSQFKSRPTHRVSASLSRAWTFPKVATTVIEPKSEDKKSGHRSQESVDRFFNCLEDSDATDDSAPASPVSFNYEQSKGLFASGFKYGAVDDDAPFYLPGGIGTIIEDPKPIVEKRLEVVAEEDEENDESDGESLYKAEEDEEMFGEIGGITFTFTPPEPEEPKEVPKQIKLASPARSAPPSEAPVLPVLDFGRGQAATNVEGDDIFRGFGRGRVEPMQAAAGAVPSVPAPPVAVAELSRVVVSSPAQQPSPPDTPPSPPRSSPIASSSIPRVLTRATPPSAIPRPISRASNSSSKSPPTVSSPPITNVFGGPSPLVTPPMKRGGAIPSFIPQASPTPTRVLGNSSFKPKSSGISPPTFIRPPGASLRSAINKPPANGYPNGSTFIPQTTVPHHTPLTMNMMSTTSMMLTKSRNQPQGRR